MAEIKAAVRKLPLRKKLELVRWLQSQVNETWSDDEIRAIAAEGARSVDWHDAADTKAKEP